MAPRKKGARLYLEAERTHKSGYTTPATYHIRDVGSDGKQIKLSTGCRSDEVEQAEQFLETYLRDKRAVERPMAKTKRADATELLIADVVSFYIDVRIEGKPSAEYPKPLARPHEVLARLDLILDFFGELSVDDIDAESCEDFADTRSTPESARRALEDLRAAIKLAVKRGKLKHDVHVYLPAKLAPREEVLTEDEVAHLLWTAYRKKGLSFSADGKPNASAYIWKHLVPYILVALYSGTRKSRIVAASYRRQPGRPWIDLKRGEFHRLARREVAHKNKQAPAVKLPTRLVAHMRRWHEHGAEYVLEYHGQPIKNPAKALRACFRAAFGEDTDRVPHTLRHTIASWLMADPEMALVDIAEYLGMSIETLVRVYGKHRKMNDGKVAAAISGRGRKVGAKSDATVDQWTYPSEKKKSVENSTTTFDSINENHSKSTGTNGNKNSTKSRKVA
jgi:integrase